MSEYGQAARLYGRLRRLDPDNEDLPTIQIEMQKLADEVDAERKAMAAVNQAKERKHTSRPLGK